MSTCSICRSDQVLPHQGKDGFTFERCARCGYVVAAPLPSQGELNELYASEHFNSSYNPDAAQGNELFQQRQKQYVQDRDLLLEFLPGGKLLDFGCGNGHFLALFPESFEKFGYEFNRVTTGWLLENARFRVLETEARLGEIDDESFDGVMMRGVVEHLIAPEEILAMLAQKLVPGGYLYICATPNVDSPCALVYGTRWNQFTPPHHLHYFSPRTLGLVGARHGLALVECRFPYLGTPYESASEDGDRFVRDAAVFLEGGALDASPPYPGTMMSLVFRKTA